MPQSLGVERIVGRRLAVLRLVANGLSSRQIAARTGLSLDGVNGHLRVIAVVLGASSRTHAVAIAMARGLLTAADIEAPKALSASQGLEITADVAESTEPLNSRQTAA